jgi:hypothetical protein
MGDLYHEALTAFAGEARSNFLICSSAGYEDDPTGKNLPYDSVFNNVAVRYPNDHVISVEGCSNREDYNRTLLPINLGGTVTAPGFAMPYDGTSFSAPMVASLITYLWSLEPNLGWETIKTLVTQAPYSVPMLSGLPPRIDAYAAVLGLDNFPTIGFEIQTGLVDVDDGTPDGQTRADPFGGAEFAQIDTPDGRRGDSIVSMRDLRTWRDAFVQVQTAGPLTDRDLDGSDLHFKKDLNFDGVIGSSKVNPAHAYAWTEPTSYDHVPPHENAFPRYDFNGDGMIDMEYRKVNGLDRRDVDLLVDSLIWQAAETNGYREGVYADPDKEGASVAGDTWHPARYALANRDASWPGVAPELAALPDYLHSCDLHLQLDFSAVDAAVSSFEVTVAAELPPDGADNNGEDGVDEPFEQVLARVATFDRQSAMPVVVTLPLWTGNVRVSWRGIGGSAPEGKQDLSGLKFGADIPVYVPGNWHVTALDWPGRIVRTVNGTPVRAGLPDEEAGTLLFQRALDGKATGWQPSVQFGPVQTGDTGYPLGEIPLEMEVIAGRPCVLALEKVGSEWRLRFFRATSATGDAWDTGTVIAANDFQSYALSDAHLAPVGGGAGVCYLSLDGFDNFDQLVSIRYVYSADGTSWGSPVVAYSEASEDILLHKVYGLTGVGDSPGIVYEFGELPAEIRYLASSDPGGGSWNAPVVIDQDFIPGEITTVGGVPAVLGVHAADQTQLVYRRANDALGTSWGVPVTVHTDPSSFNTLSRGYSLAVIGGRPAVAFAGAARTKVQYVRAADAAGTQWPNPDLILDTGVQLRDFSLSDVAGRPALGFTDNGSGKLAIFW